MKYLASARKWRPSRFDEMVGQEHVSFTLKNAIKSNRISHAYLFAGPRGVGKTTAARIFAKAVNCLKPEDFEPCNKCENCLAFQNNQTLDIIEIDGASNRKIEDIRALRESVKYAPTTGKYKVYIIDEVHMLTNESFNALLKTLEEPPEFAIFIFATTDVHKVPLTIISRCQRFDFRRIEVDTIKKHLRNIAQKEGIIIDDKSLTVIAKKADGALRDSLSIFDQAAAFCGQEIRYEQLSEMLNLIDEDIYFQISEAIDSKNFKAAYEIVKRIYDNGWNYVDFLNGLIEHFNNYMIILSTGNANLLEVSEIDKEKYLATKNNYSISDCLRILNFLQKINYEIKTAQNPRIRLETALCHLIGYQKTSFISDLTKQLEKAAQEGIEIKINTGYFENRSDLKTETMPSQAKEKFEALKYEKDIYHAEKNSKPIEITVKEIEKNEIKDNNKNELLDKEEKKENIEGQEEVKNIEKRYESTIDKTNIADLSQEEKKIEDIARKVINEIAKYKTFEIKIELFSKAIQVLASKSGVSKIEIFKSIIEKELENKVGEKFTILAIEKESKKKVNLEKLIAAEKADTDSDFVKAIKDKLGAKEIR